MEFNLKTITEIVNYHRCGDIIICHMHVLLKIEYGIKGLSRSVISIGRAKCNKEDNFNERFGRALARTRANIRLSKEIEKILISLTRSREWKKRGVNTGKLRVGEFIDIECPYCKSDIKIGGFPCTRRIKLTDR